MSPSTLLRLGLRGNKSNIRADTEEKLFLDREMSALVSDMFSSLYDTKSLSEMKKEEFKGLEEFLKGEWEITSRGEATWQYTRGSRTDYSYTYSMTVRVVEEACREGPPRQAQGKSISQCGRYTLLLRRRDSRDYMLRIRRLLHFRRLLSSRRRGLPG